VQPPWRATPSKRLAISTATVASPGRATLWLNARSRVVGRPARADFCSAGRIQRFALAMRALVVARRKCLLLRAMTAAFSESGGPRCGAGEPRVTAAGSFFGGWEAHRFGLRSEILGNSHSFDPRPRETVAFQSG
jgi:hypothetical protein